jgi:hypothetical protein
MSDAADRSATVAHEKYQRLIKLAQRQAAIRVAIAHPCDDVSLEGAVEAARLRLIEPLLVGPVERIRRVADSAGLDIGAMEIVASAHSDDSAAKAVELVSAGRVEALMKGSLHTDELMAAVVSRQAGIRTARRISHCFIMDVPHHPDALIITDAAVNIAPTLDDKVDIVQNAIDLAHAMGIAEVRVAILSAMETVSAKCPRRSRQPPCARWPSGGRSPGRSWMDHSLSTTQSVRRRPPSSRSGLRWQDTRISWWSPTSKPATCWPRACRSWRRPMQLGSCLVRVFRSS